MSLYLLLRLFAATSFDVHTPANMIYALSSPLFIGADAAQLAEFQYALSL